MSNNVILLHQAIMLISDINKLPMHQISSRRTDSGLSQENESDPKHYRYLFSIFSENVNNVLKANQDCFGEMEFHPKIKISREEMQVGESNLQYIFDKNQMKMCRESLYRNYVVKKSYEQYSKLYRETCPLYKQIDHKTHNDSFIAIIKKGVKHQDKKYSSPIHSISLRKKTTPSISNPKSILYLSHTFKTFQQNNKSFTFKMKTISSQFNENPERSKERQFLKTTRYSMSKEERIRAKINLYQSRKESRQYLQSKPIIKNQDIIFSGNQILIAEPHFKSNEQTNKKLNISQTNKFCTKRVVAIGQPQKNAINDIQKLHQRNKNMDIIFWSNPNQMRCFQPRIRCWQNIFVQE